MEKFTFNTGRGYSAEGQIIDIYNIMETTEYCTILEANEPVTLILMHDKSRGIPEHMLFYCAFADITEDDIMRSYDKYRYADISAIAEKYGLDASTINEQMFQLIKGK
jgi:hypothetical protein